MFFNCGCPKFFSSRTSHFSLTTYNLFSYLFVFICMHLLHVPLSTTGWCWWRHTGVFDCARLCSMWNILDFVVITFGELRNHFAHSVFCSNHSLPRNNQRTCRLTGESSQWVWSVVVCVCATAHADWCQNVSNLLSFYFPPDQSWNFVILGSRPFGLQCHKIFRAQRPLSGIRGFGAYK